ncbi:hypothetical protein O9993_03815 [Vibrio lentus]|nr:hypothetical protein [Vibrio lentus]
MRRFKIRNELKLTTVVFACTADVFKEAHGNFIHRGLISYSPNRHCRKTAYKNAINEFHHTSLSLTGITLANAHNRQNKDRKQHHHSSALHVFRRTSYRLTEEEVSRNLL